MPEIKSSFLGGKMNKDLDERLLPKGQYRNAKNIEISTAEGSDVGTVKSVLGNKRLEDLIDPGFTCVGTIADEKNNKLYWFISTYLQDGIWEYDTINDIMLPVLLDLNASNSKAVLRFGTSTMITGINIIDNLLLWTDNLTNPKKINIDECKKGTSINADGSWNHTQLLFENGSFNGVTIPLVSPWSGSSASHAVYFNGQHPQTIGRYAFAEVKQLKAMVGISETEQVNWSIYDNISTYTRHYRDGKFLGLKRISLDRWGKIVWFDDPNRYALTQEHTENQKVWKVGDVLFGNEVTVDIEERHITVIKPKPLLAPSVKINHNTSLDTLTILPNLFETTFPRFSYRYKFKDGEFSTFAPFTSAVFNPKYPKDVNNSTATSVFYNKDNAYDIKDPSNKAMTNSIHSIELTDFITANTPEDVVEIDILYKQENSSVIYSIDTIKPTDAAWHESSNHEGLGLGLGVGQHPNHNSGSFYLEGGRTKGKYVVTTENIYAALPANQLLRPWDNVPRRAQAQEVTGNRIVYGNYLQNYNLGDYKTKIKVGYDDRKNSVGSFETQGLPSVKSQRNYQLGVVYCDKYGRETPVLTSNDAALTVPWTSGNGLKNASRSLQLNANIVNNFPEWVDSMKFFIKETSNEYYNLVMQKAWVIQKTYDLDDSEGNIWISFPSSDRNKIAEGEYIILKKKIGVGENQVASQNKFKVIDIKNEAPDAIRYELYNYGSSTNAANKLTLDLFESAEFRMDKETDILEMEIGEWMNSASIKGAKLYELGVGNMGNMYISWSRIGVNGTGVSSSKYAINHVGLSLVIDNQGTYTLRLKNKISKIDADIAHLNGESEGDSNGPATMHPDLVVKLESKEVKTGEDFSGLFFVKISKNQITEIIESGNNTSVLDNYQVSSKTPIWWWRDDIAGPITSNSLNSHLSEIRVSDSDYGISNYNGYDTESQAGANRIQDASNNAIGNGKHVTANYPASMRLTDISIAWEGIYSKYVGSTKIGTFFLDAMHMVAGQSQASDYAKYCCVTWSGASGDGTDVDLIKGDSAWSYPPLKTWIGDYEDAAGLIENLDTDTPLLLDNMLVSTSPTMNSNQHWLGSKVDGWIGPSQHVKRKINSDILSALYTGESGASGYPADASPTHVNGLEGLITSQEDHSTSCRRWFSGITGNATEIGVGVDTKTYSNNGETGRYFMHLSFFAPGDDLHDGVFGANGFDSHNALYGPTSISAHLQGIWGGGHFTGVNLSDTFGSASQLAEDDGGFTHLSLEGNYDSNGDFLSQTPGPGVGFGYDINYKEKHERQWDPTFPSDPGNKIRDYIKNIRAGAQFKFNPSESGHPNTTSATRTKADESIYTIKSVSIKKLYNHTSWRNTFNRWQGGTFDGSNAYLAPADTEEFWSVERAGLAWLSTMAVGDNGQDSKLTTFKNKIKDFGKSHNRRVCYIIELDKNPTENANFNPIDTGLSDGRLTADQASGEFHNIEFLEKVKSIAGINDLNKFPAVWETDPVKQEVDLDIYYEASSNIPVRINSKTNELLAPIGCEVEILNAAISSTSNVLEWNGNVVTLAPGFEVFDNANEIDYEGVSFKFIKQDGSFIIAKAAPQQLVGAVAGDPPKTEFTFEENIGDNIRVGLAWNNCFSFGNGLESNRIGDDFNKMYLINGVKASTTTQKTYEEERRSTGLIYSGLYNSNSGVNDLNQFIMAEKITKDLNPTFGSIQKLFQRRISLIAFCEDRVVSITSNKDALFNADGNSQLISTNAVLGDASPFEGNFGISKNPESFASESYRAYFTDKNRGAVVRLSKDGLTPISSSGMHDWFRDNIQEYTSLIGTFDSYKEDYNLTLSNRFGENIIFNSYLGNDGIASTTQQGSLANIIQNASIFDGVHFQYPYEIENVLTHPAFEWGVINQGLQSDIIVTNHESIPAGSIQTAVAYVAPILYEEAVAEVLAVAGVAEVLGVDAVEYVEGVTAVDYIEGVAAVTAVAGVTAVIGSEAVDEVLEVIGVDEVTAVIGVDYVAPVAAVDAVAGVDYVAGVAYEEATYDSAANLPDNGHIYYPGNFPGIDSSLNPPNLMFGGNAVKNSDSNIYSQVRRKFDGAMVQENGLFNGNGTTYDSSGAINSTRPSLSGYGFNVFNGNDPGANGRILINHLGGSILFNRCTQASNGYDTYVEFRDLGALSSNTSLNGHLNEDYNTAVGSFNEHSCMFAGDEIDILVEIRVWDTKTTYFSNTSQGASWQNWRSYNEIRPFIQILDGTSFIDSNKLQQQNYGNIMGVGNPQPTGIYNQPTMGGDNGLGGGSFTLPILNNYYWQNPLDETLGTGSYVSVGAGSVEDASLSPDKYFSGGGTNDSQYVFPLTTTRDNGGTLGAPVAETYALRLRYKFKDPTQSYNSITEQFHDAKIVNDLRIRIGNYQKNTSSTRYNRATWLTSNTGTGREKKQKWEITSVKVKKVLGITGVDTEFIEAVEAVVAVDAVAAVTEVAYVASVDAVTAVAAVEYVPGIPAVQPVAGVTEVLEVTQVTEVLAVAGVTEVLAVTGVTAVAAVQAIAGVTGLAEVAADPGVAQVTAVPLVSIPAWTQVSHFGLNGWTKTDDGNNTSYISSKSITEFGGDYLYESASGILQNSNPAIPGDVTVNYIKPSEYLPASYSLTGEAVSGTPFSPNTPFTGAANGFNVNGDGLPDSGVNMLIDNDYFHVNTGALDTVGLVQGIFNSPWEDNEWYLIDIEFDENYNPDTGSGGEDGFVYINGVLDRAGTSGDIHHPKGVGTFVGNTQSMHCRLLPTVRTEYGNRDGSGDQKTVLRAIFKFNPNSWRADTSAPNRRNFFKIVFSNFENAGRITKIISKKLNFKTTTGTANHWYGKHGNQSHSFDTPKTYWSSTGPGASAKTLCIQEPPFSSGRPYSQPYWAQSFVAGGGPLTSNLGWTFRFTVTKNPKTNSFLGELNAYLNTELSPDNGSTGAMESLGILVKGIDAPGEYEINFNFGTPAADWTVSSPSNNTTVEEYPDPTSGSVDNKVVWYAPLAQTVCGIKDTVLLDNTELLLGGTVGSWAWDGFDQTQENYITWDDVVNISTGVQENRIQFNNCPATDPDVALGSTVLQFTPINASQYIDNPIKRNERYVISFEHGIYAGELSIYYFNAEGAGFKLHDIDSSTQGTVTKTVTIGAGEHGREWSTVNPSGPTYAPEMKETLVIRPRALIGEVTSGWIDNITMTKSYVFDVDDQGDPIFAAKTVSFNEGVNGWTSFKDFIPEAGVSLSKKYYTFNQGGLFQHYVPLAYQVAGPVSTYTAGHNTQSLLPHRNWVDSTVELAENYNVFYGIDTYSSSIKTVLNDEPGIVKVFNTLNYEGSQSQVIKPMSINQVTDSNAAAWIYGNIDGWKCTEIKTDLEAGSVEKFIKKEGKWFGYIKGAAHASTLDTSRFSVQGIGIPSSITQTPILVPIGTIGEIQ